MARTKSDRETRLDGTRTRRQGTEGDGEGPARGRDEELFVTCNDCGWPIATGIRVPRGALESRRPPVREHRCPRCGAAATYEPAAYGHRD